MVKIASAGCGRKHLRETRIRASVTRDATIPIERVNSRYIIRYIAVHHTVYCARVARANKHSANNSRSSPFGAVEQCAKRSDKIDA